MNLPLAIATASTMLTLCPAATFVYVSNSDSNDIHVMSLNPATGELALVERTEIPAIVNCRGINNNFRSKKTSLLLVPLFKVN